MTGYKSNVIETSSGKRYAKEEGREVTGNHLFLFSGFEIKSS
jgi:hypothetical protein